MPKTPSRTKKRLSASYENVNIQELISSINLTFPPTITAKDLLAKVAPNGLKWSYEPNFVKSHYTKLADEAKRDYKKLCTFFIIVSGPKNEKETNSQQQSFDIEIETDNCNTSTHVNNNIGQEYYNNLTFEQQEMNLHNTFLNEFSAPYFSNESYIFLYDEPLTPTS
ncbi:3769_t:CDS:2 [Scutellospora calospora]|uniref:3769_t:CDS:1 n=1 Tax=Scutellospora calospora TaxID=85575 RepID=A0ACA9LZD8_9GLOM|nr:3769_t:CDS:2 [Scutellospora calospora]